MSNQDVSKIIDLGPCFVNFNGVDLGHTGETGIKVMVKQQFVEGHVGAFGKTPVKTFLSGTDLEVEGELAQAQASLLYLALPGATKVTNGPNSKMTFGQISGKENTGAVLILTPMITGNDPSNRITIYNAVPIGEWDVLYDGEKQQLYKMKFKAHIDEGKTDGNYLFTYGDTTISADLVNPVVSAWNPLDNATGVNVNTTPVATISKNLDSSSVNTNNVKLIADPLGTAVEVPGSVTLVNNGASTQVTFTPTAPLAALTQHMFYLSSAVKDQSGNALAWSEADFTTA